MDLGEARRVLAVHRSATPIQVKEAYHGMLRRWHPDLVEGSLASEAVVRTQRINEAYELLRRQPAVRPWIGWNGWLIRTTMGRFELQLVLWTAFLAFLVPTFLHFLAWVLR